MLEGNKESVRRLFEAMGNGHYDDALAELDPDGSWWVLSKRAASTNAEFIGIYEKFIGTLFPDGVSFEVGEMTAEGNRVSALVSSNGTLTDGRTYNNLYHFLFYFDEHGKIVDTREYQDTLHAQHRLRDGI
jgi:ketosteroid isomerase-like protein